LFCQNYIDAKLVCQTVVVAHTRDTRRAARPWKGNTAARRFGWRATCWAHPYAIAICGSLVGTCRPDGSEPQVGLKFNIAVHAVPFFLSSKSMDHTSCFVGTKTEAKEYFSSEFKFYSIFFHFFSTPKKSEKENKHGRGAGERRLVAYTAPRARLSGCNFPPLACIPRNARNRRFCRARLGSCSCFSH
jgi:hypothetical protein